MQIDLYKSKVISAIKAIDESAVHRIISEILQRRKNENSIFIAGNGGSAATASHLVTDFMFGSGLTNPPLRIVSLNDNTSVLTATGNDVGFEKLFSRQLDNLGKKGDLVILISASGRSPNIINCIGICKSRGMRTIGFTGFDGGILHELVDISLHIPTELEMYGVVEDVHMIVGHMITEKLKYQNLDERN